LIIHYLDLPSANPLKLAPLSSLELSFNILSSSSIRVSISKASKIASFLVAAAFFNLSADMSSSESTIFSLATFINSSTAFCPAWIILSFVSFVFILN